MFDTHAHLNFEAFENNLDGVIAQAKEAGITKIVIPGSNVENSKRGVEIAQKYPDIYAAVGIHPFHVYGHFIYSKDLEKDYKELEKLLQEDKVVAVGEVGLDRNAYKSKKYPDYQVTQELINLQKQAFIRQIKLAIRYKKSLIIHNRGAAEEVIELLQGEGLKLFNPGGWKLVFHMCQPEEILLEFAKAHGIFISVGGDVTYDKIKQEFVKKIPLELLVLETDSPYILPEPLKSQGEKVNQPANLVITLEFLSKLLGLEKEVLKKTTIENSLNLFKFNLAN